jgi:preprotein translocase subunit SecF
MRLFKNANFQFVEKRKMFFVFSITLMVLSVGLLVAKGGPNYGIDFKGGSFVHVKFSSSPDLSRLRSVFKTYGEFGAVIIKGYGRVEDNEVMIGVQKQEEVGVVIKTITEILNKEFSGDFEILREEAVGPKIGKELRWRSILSILLSLLAVILYIWLRFQFKFGLSAIAALFHDVVITLGVFSALDLEVSLPIIAAFLTIIGYSLNDTIVVFDRIRENLFGQRKLGILEVINRSINQSLGRTVVTSLTTLIAVLSLYFLGVSVIKDLAFALIVGVIIGTYSSIGVASSILASWNPDTLRKAKRV